MLLKGLSFPTPGSSFGNPATAWKTHLLKHSSKVCGCHRQQFIWLHFATEVAGGRCAGKGEWKHAMDWLEQTRIRVDSATYASLLRRFGNANALSEGKRLHAHLIKIGYEGDTFLGNLLVEMFGKCGALEDAREVFGQIRGRNVFSWTVLIRAYVRQGRYEVAISLFQQMLMEGVKPDKVVFVTILSACASPVALPEGKRIHAHIRASGFESAVTVGTALVSMYGKCGSLEGARMTFNTMPERNVVSWNAMIGAYAQHGQGKRALQLFQQMQLEGVAPDKFTYVSILSACANEGVLAEGKQVHAHIVAGRLEGNAILGNALVNMYGKCGSLDDAQYAFSKIAEPNVVSWNAMVAAHAQHGQAKKALQVFQQMHMEGAIPNRVTFLNILSACVSSSALAEGKQIHAHIVACGYESDFVLGNALLNMYSNCGSLSDAETAFDNIFELNVVSWNAMIKAYVQHGQGKKALQVFEQMQLEGVIPDKVTFVNALSACASPEDLAEGKQIEAQTLVIGFMPDIVVGNAFINMYGKCGSLKDAQRMFDKMPERNAVSWNAIIAAYSQNGKGKEALELFQQMQLEGMIPNEVTLVSALSACVSHAYLADGKWIHSRIVASGLEFDVAMGTALINMYGKCGSLEDAWRIFDRLPEHNVVSWNAMIAACVRHGHGKEATQLFQQMQLECVVPDKVTFVSILSACASQAALAQGKQMHSHIVACGFESGVVIGTALISMYGRCGSLNDARRMFDTMPEQTSVSWNAMMAAYVQHGEDKEALQLFQQMELESVIPDKSTFVSIVSACANLPGLTEGKKIHAYSISNRFESDMVVRNTLINMYAKCGSLEDAQWMFDKMPERSVISWNVMLAACAQHGQGMESCKLFKQMKMDGVIPNELTFVSVLSACSRSGLVDEGRRCFVSMRQDYGITPTVEHYNCMIDLLGRVGWLEEGEDLIVRMPYEPTAMTWMTLLAACRMHLDVERGKRAAENVFRFDPDNATPYIMLSNIYSATGQWDDAAQMRKMMENKCLKKAA